MKIESKVISKIIFNIRLDDTNVIESSILVNLFLEEYYDYFYHLILHRFTKNQSIADIEINYGNNGCKYVNDKDYKQFLPLFFYLENLKIIKLDRTDEKYKDYPHKYDILDFEKLEYIISEITEFARNFYNDEESLIRETYITQMLED